MPTSKEDQVTLELIVDRHGLFCVMSMLEEICGEKAEHLAVNWQDAKSGKVWAKAAAHVAYAAEKVDQLNIP